MKQCPVCQNTYSDDTLQFCLEDGAALTFASGEQPTQVIPSGNNPIRVNIPKDTSPTVVTQPNYPPPTQPPTEKRGGSGLIIGLLVAVLLLVVLGSGAVIGWLLLRDSGNSNKPEIASNNKTSNSSTNVTASNSPTPDETANLRNKIANLEKQMQDQKNQKPTPPTISNTNTTSNQVTARVNSPNDGFLALRTEPSAENGERILQIPHGASVTVISCLAKEAGRKGRWCRVNYNGNFGWAFDQYLTY